MKQITRFTAAAMVGVSSLAIVSITMMALFSSGHGGFFRDHFLANSTLLGWIINALSLVGWICLLRNRVWAWTMLVWLTAISSVGVLFSIASAAFHSDSLAWTAAFVPFPFGLANVPALVLLLTDKPSGWSETEPEVAPSDQHAGNLKKRTRVVAWVFLVLSVWSLVQLPLAVMAFRHRPVSWVSGLLGSLLWVFWIALLRGRMWAWQVLVAAYAATSAWYIWGIAQAPAYYAAHHKAFTHPWQAMIPSAVMLVLMGLIPLWALLADRPSGWHDPSEVAA